MYERAHIIRCVPRLPQVAHGATSPTSTEMWMLGDQVDLAALARNPTWKLLYASRMNTTSTRQSTKSKIMPLPRLRALKAMAITVGRSSITTDHQ